MRWPRRGAVQHPGRRPRAHDGDVDTGRSGGGRRRHGRLYGSRGAAPARRPRYSLCILRSCSCRPAFLAALSVRRGVSGPRTRAGPCPRVAGGGRAGRAGVSGRAWRSRRPGSKRIYGVETARRCSRGEAMVGAEWRCRRNGRVLGARRAAATSPRARQAVLSAVSILRVPAHRWRVRTGDGVAAVATFSGRILDDEEELRPPGAG